MKHMIERMFPTLHIALNGLSFSRDGQVFLCKNEEMQTVRSLWRRKMIQPLDVANNFDGTHSVAFSTLKEADAAAVVFKENELREEG